MRDDTKFTNIHHIQKSIIYSLSSKSPQRFTDLKIPRLANNTFSYHLKKLQESNYIELTSEGYMPTRKALKQVVFSPTETRDRGLLKTITMVQINNTNDEILLINRSNNPFMGWYGLPSGVIHFGEDIKQSAAREVLEKTGLTVNDQDLVSTGVLEFKYVNETSNDIFIHVIAFVFKLKLKTDYSELNDKYNKYGQLSWSKLGRKYILPEVFTAVEMAKEKSCKYYKKQYCEPITRLLEKNLVHFEDNYSCNI